MDLSVYNQSMKEGILFRNQLRITLCHSVTLSFKENMFIYWIGSIDEIVILLEFLYRQEQRFLIMYEYRLGSVSYTHLTLPTIYSV